MKIILVFLATGFLFFSCSNNKKDTISDLKEEVMALHDEVMPKMDQLYKTQKQLLALADSTDANDSVTAAKYRELANTIEIANESMMDWMRNFEPAYSEEDADLYFEGQKKSISKVKDDMLNSLKAGQDALK